MGPATVAGTAGKAARERWDGGLGMTQVSEAGHEGLELNDDPVFDRRQGRVQRVGWALLALVLVAALAGVFGSGPVSSGSAASDDGRLEVGFDRFVRRGGENALDLTLDPALAEAGEIEVAISATWLDGIDVEAVSPEPTDVRTEGDRQVYVFAVAGDAPLVVTLSYSSQVVGRSEATVTAGPGEVSFWQVSYP
jgi:hypothetical protein